MGYMTVTCSGTPPKSTFGSSLPGIYQVHSIRQSPRRASTYSNLDGFSMNGMSTSSDRLH